jgi:hypothetical protein
VVWFDASELIGRPKINMAFSLLNQNLAATPTGGNTFSFVVLLKYNILLSSGTLPLKP